MVRLVHDTAPAAAAANARRDTADFGFAVSDLSLVPMGACSCVAQESVTKRASVPGVADQAARFASDVPNRCEIERAASWREQAAGPCVNRLALARIRSSREERQDPYKTRIMDPCVGARLRGRFSRRYDAQERLRLPCGSPTLMRLQAASSLGS